MYNYNPTIKAIKMIVKKTVYFTNVTHIKNKRDNNTKIYFKKN
jgi:hypothetical protein